MIVSTIVRKETVTTKLAIVAILPFELDTDSVAAPVPGGIAAGGRSGLVAAGVLVYRLAGRRSRSERNRNGPIGHRLRQPAC